MPPPQLTATAPADGASAVPVDRVLTAFFSEDLDPKSVDARLGLGDTLNQMGAHEEAVAHFREGVRLDPDHSLTQAFLGHALFDRGHDVRLRRAAPHHDGPQSSGRGDLVGV